MLWSKQDYGNAERGARVLGLLLSTVAYFVASYYIKRYLDEIDAPRGLTRSALIFCAALLIAYGVAFLVDWITS